MKGGEIVRYGLATRIVHWAIALLFVLLFLSGLALFHPSFYWLAELFGGGATMRVLHPFMGVSLCLFFLGYAAGIWRKNLLVPGDREWLANAMAIMSKKKDVPVPGKYNAGQKVMFWVMGVSVLGLTATGLMFWRPYFTETFGAEVRRVAIAAHVVFAFLMFAAIGVHVYAAFFTKGSTSAMLRGTVPRAWAKAHHPGWYREVTTTASGQGAPPAKGDARG
jgi:formate dehydrogenase subunit gamma